MRMIRAFAMLGVVAGLAAGTALRAPAQSESEPETVLVTYHVKDGQQAQMESIIRKQWAALRRLDVVEEQPHLLLRGVEDGGKPVYAEVFAWKTADSADHLPAEIQTLWKLMNSLVESRSGRPGIDIHPMAPLPAQ